MIAIFRHGQTQNNEAGIIQGWINSSLTNLGEKQVEYTALHFREIYLNPLLPRNIYHSSLGRSRKSAEIFMQHVRVDECVSCDSLKERNYGQLEGKKDKIQSRFLNHPSKNAESLAEVYERVNRLLDYFRIRYDDPCHTNIFHVHGNVSKILRGIFLNLHFDHWLNFEHSFDTYFIINGNICQEVKC